MSIIAADAVASAVVGRRGEALNSPTDPDAQAGYSRQCEGSDSGHPFPFVRMPPPQASAASPTRRARTISPQGRTAPLAPDDPVGKRGRTETIISDEPDSDNGSPLGQSGNPGNLGGYPGSRTNRGRAADSSPRGVRRTKKDSSSAKPTRSTSRRRTPAIQDITPQSSALAHAFRRYAIHDALHRAANSSQTQCGRDDGSDAVGPPHHWYGEGRADCGPEARARGAGSESGHSRADRHRCLYCGDELSDKRGRPSPERDRLRASGEIGSADYGSHGRYTALP